MSTLVERGLPAIESATLATEVPLTGGERRSLEAAGEAPVDAEYRSVASQYFETLRTPILSGRDFSLDDREGSAPVVIVNQTLAHRLFHDDPLGRSVRVLSADGVGVSVVSRRVIGVVADVRQSIDGRSPPPMAYVPLRQDPASPLSLLVRSRSEEAVLGRAILDELQAPTPDLLVLSTFAMDRRVDARRRSHQFLPLSISIFAVFGLVLAAVGLFGTVARSVAQRTREIGVRRTLGAGVSDILRLVLRQGGRGAAIGIALGAFAAWVASTLFLSALEPHERTSVGVDLLNRLDVAATVVGSLAVLLLVVLAASWIPAARALRIAPAEALRHD